MRILYLSQYFPPEVGATQTRAYEMARGLAAAGHDVTMIAEVPNHPSGIIPPAYQGKLYEKREMDGIEVIRVWVKASPVKTFRNRMAFYLSYMISATLAGLLLARGRYDLLYVTSPPLFAGAAGLALSYLRGIPLVFEVRDLWPESAVVLGELRGRRAIRMAEWLEKQCYRRARRIVVVTEGIRSRLLERGIPEKKLALIPNGTNTTLFVPQPAEGAALAATLGLDGKFVVLYAGIMGIAQGLEVALNAARCLQQHENVRFLFVGEGPAKAELVARAEGLHNVIFHPEVSRAEMPAYLSMAGAALVPLRKHALFEGALPSKMFDAWACACPTLVAISGEARQILERAEAGIWVEPENAEALAGAVLALAEDPYLRARFGENGRRFVSQYYSRQEQARQLSLLLEKTAA